MTVRAPGPTTETDHGPLFIIDALKGTNGTSMFITAILHPHHATPTLNISLSKEACGGPACVSLERVFQPYVGYERIGDAIRRANEDGEIVGEMDAQVLKYAVDSSHTVTMRMMRLNPSSSISDTRNMDLARLRRSRERVPVWRRRPRIESGMAVTFPRRAAPRI
ncbi:hypothetical protein PLICRDRAFT_41123 [Plicaturopsis crispa FD-325 SS-3]|nr:hypothetical protein PLICRDRAFT_41123 [Plicaturopsis crispa FD-325 SS-3]